MERKVITILMTFTLTTSCTSILSQFPIDLYVLLKTMFAILNKTFIVKVKKIRNPIICDRSIGFRIVDEIIRPWQQLLRSQLKIQVKLSP